MKRIRVELLNKPQPLVTRDQSEEALERAEYMMLAMRTGAANGLRTLRGKQLFGDRAQVKLHLRDGYIEILADDATYVIRFT